MITFYPGPSKIYPQIETYLQDAIIEGILSQNHRSQAFMDMLKECIRLFKEKLNIPAEYHVYFTSSATECWEIVAQSLTSQGSHHIYNGAFGKKWFEYTQKNAAFPVSGLQFGIEENIPVSIDFPKTCDVICLTQNETSNSTQVAVSTIPTIADKLIAIDVTSSLGGIELDWQKGDIWLGSVQKCLGLPAGLGVMICSPRALKQAEDIGDRKFYNSLLFIHENFQKYQTHYTPNVLGIYLLMRVMQQVAPINILSSYIKARAADFYNFIKQETNFQLLIENPTVRSDTVIAIQGTMEAIKDLKQSAKENGIILGNGYGSWKDTTFRLANFPAIQDKEFEQLKTLLRR